MTLKNKTVLITGAGRGLGAALAICCADQGALVTVAGRNIENLSAVADVIRQRTGMRPEIWRMDLADISHVTLSAKKMRDDNRPLDILINNAAQWLPGGMDTHDAYAIANTITANITGTLLLTRGLLPLLEKSGAGDIVNIVSLSGLMNAPLQGGSVAYMASKYGQTGMTEALRQELRDRPVRVSGIYPPYIRDISPLEPAWNETPPLDSYATNRDVVETVLFALSRPRHVSLAVAQLDSDRGNFFHH